MKWLGSVAPGVLALDGKLSKDQVTAAIRRWSDLSGKSVTQPGKTMSFLLLQFHIELMMPSFYDSSVLIVSYETLRNLTTELGQTPVGLLLCDEGHRLKNSDSQTFKALNELKCERRVILSGTPIQNDLTEYFSLLSFANPALLGDRSAFRKNFELAILKGRDAMANDKDTEAGKAKLKELSNLVSKFIIRRTNDLLSKYRKWIAVLTF